MNYVLLHEFLKSGMSSVVLKAMTHFFSYQQWCCLYSSPRNDLDGLC